MFRIRTVGFDRVFWYTFTMKKNVGKEKVAVITGGSSGIGQQLVHNLRAYGYTVVNVSRHCAAGDENVCDFFACDLSDRAQTKNTAERILQKYPHIDLLINNAGLGISGATELLSEESVRYVMEVDYFAPLLFTRALLPHMPANSKIVMISSACALFALPYRNVYCSAKAALSMLSYGLRMELARRKICVVTVCPGDIRSNFTENRLKFTDTNETYGGSVLAAQQKIDSREHKRMSLIKASKKITKIAVKKKKALYIIGAKYKFLYACSKILPQSVLLKMTEKLFLPKK